MNVFQTHADIVSDYATYIRSFLKIDDPAIRHKVEEALNQGKPSIMRLVIDDNDKMPLSKEVRSGLDMSPATFGDIKATFKRAIRDFEGELEANGATWYSDQWIDKNLSKVADNLDRSLDRWRRLYRSARTILSRATQKIESGTLSLGSDEYCKHIPKIMEAMEKNGSPPAEFEFDDDHSYFMVRLPIHTAALEVAESQSRLESRPESGGESTQSPTQSPTQSSDPVERLLIALKQGEQSSGDLREALGIRHRPNFRENYLHPALAQGFIEYTLPDKPNSRLQQYRLTDKGRARLADLESAKP